MAAMLEGDDHRFAYANRAAFTTSSGIATLPARPWPRRFEFTAHGFDEILDGVARSGEAFTGHGMPLTVARVDGSSEEILVDLVFQPVPASDGQPGIFVQGHKTEDKRSGDSRRHNKVLEARDRRQPARNDAQRAHPDRRRIVAHRRARLDPQLLDADGKLLRHGAAPSLPRLNVEADRRKRRSVRARGSCGTCGIPGRGGVRVRYRDRSFVGGLQGRRRPQRASRLLVDPDP